MEIQTQTQNLQDSWTGEQINQLGKALTFSYKMQNTYKEPLDLEDRLAGWKFVLEEDYTMEQVLYGLKKFLKDSEDMPVPSNINNILNPPKPLVTTAQFIAARDNQARNGYPAFSTDDMIIREYEAQEADKQEEHKFESNELTELAGKAVKRIEG